MPGKVYLLNVKNTGVVAVNGPAGSTSSVGAVSLQIDSASTSPAWSGSLLVQAQLPDGTLKNVGYFNFTTDATATPGTAITATGHYEVVSNGFPVTATYTHTAGTARLTMLNLEGPSHVPGGSGGGGGGGAATIANGADVAEGSTTDAAVIGDTAGTVSAKLRGLNSVLTGTTYNATDGLLRIELVKDSTPLPAQPLSVQVQDPTFTYVLPTGDAPPRAIYTAISDRSNTAVVKPASTAAIATDQALVVTMSPNSTGKTLITDGTNTAAVKASTTAPATTDPALVTALSPNQWVANVSTIGTTFTGLPATATLAAFDGTNFRRLSTANAATDGSVASTILQVGISANVPGGTNFDRVKTFAADAQTTGVLAGGVMGWNGTGADRIRGSKDAGLIVKSYALPAQDWSYPAVSGGIVNTTAVTIKTAAGASTKNYLTWLDLSNSGAAGTEVSVRDGAAGTVIYRCYIGAGGSRYVRFPSPLASTANTLLEVVLLNGTTVAVYVNAGGYTAA